MMLRSVRELRHVAMNATDGRIGFVEQVFFDDERWTIRYLVVDTDQAVADRRVLVSPLAVTGIDPATGTIAVRLTRRQVAESPDIDTDKPVSRQKELEYNRYFLLPSYWIGGQLWGTGMLPGDLMAQTVPPPGPEEKPGDMHLRSSREVIGYRVKASDGKVGHVEDFLYDDASWRIRYAAVDTRNWIGGRHVLVSPRWAWEVSWNERAIALDLPVQTIRTAPEYRSPVDVTEEFEQRLLAHYARQPE